MLKLYWRNTDVFLGDLSSEDEAALRQNFEESPDRVDGEFVAYSVDQPTLEYAKGSGISPELAEMLTMALEEQEAHESEPVKDKSSIKALVYVEDDFDYLSNFYLRLPDHFQGEISQEELVFLIEKMETADGFSFELDKLTLGYLNMSGINTHLKTLLAESLGEQERIFISVEDTEENSED